MYFLTSFNANIFVFQISDHKFLCPNNTIFDQQNLICASWWDTECNKTPIVANDPFNIFEEARAADSSSTSTTTPPPPTEAPAITDEEAYLYYEYLNEYGQDPSTLQNYDYDLYEGRTGRSKKVEDIPLGRSVVQSSSSQNSLQSTTEKSKSSTENLLVSQVLSTTEQTIVPPVSITSDHAFRLPFESSFEVGKPVVSISSTSSRLEVSSTRYASSTPKYGYFSIQHPSTTPKYEKNITVRRSTPQTTEKSTLSTRLQTEASVTTSTPVRSRAKPSFLVREIKASDLVSISDSEDPFADIDWKKDSSSGVTATTRTRYEASFGSASEEKVPPVVAIGRQRSFKSEPSAVTASGGQKTSVTSSVSSSARVTASRVNPSTRNKLLRDGSIGGRRRTRQRSKSNENGRPRRIITGPSRQDFSNFRYFKTAFGDRQNTENSEPARIGRSRQTKRFSDSLFGRRTLRLKDSDDEPQRTASRNTRYSVFA